MKLVQNRSNKQFAENLIVYHRAIYWHNICLMTYVSVSYASDVKVLLHISNVKIHHVIERGKKGKGKMKEGKGREGTKRKRLSKKEREKSHVFYVLRLRGAFIIFQLPY